MEAKFWIERWQSNHIGFHQAQFNEALVKFFPTLVADKGERGEQTRVFVPLCGKTLDMQWLLAQSCRVVGVELSKLAVEQFFEEMKWAPVIKKIGATNHDAEALYCYSAPNLDIFVGDIFKLDAATLGAVDFIYDRAALVALPPALRDSYCQHLQQLCPQCPQLLLCFEYDQALASPPPFSIDEAQVMRQYGAAYHLILLEKTNVKGGIKGTAPAQEAAWSLVPKTGYAG